VHLGNHRRDLWPPLISALRWRPLLLFGLCFSAIPRSAPASERGLTVWLMPAEQAGPNAPVAGEEIRREIQDFNRRLEGKHVTVLNTLPPLDTQLMVRNPQAGLVNWSWISSQQRTLDALERFAAARSVQVNVRFVTWDQAFAELRSHREEGATNPSPDVAQIGNTWSGNFAAAGLLASRPGAPGNWRTVHNHHALALPFINDVRLLFYWKRRLSRLPSDPALQLDGKSWESIIHSFQAHAEAGDSIALASGLTLNLLHDYASFVWAGGGQFLHSGFRDHVDLTSAAALRVPLLLTRAVHSIDPNSGPRQTVSFPEAPHEEVSRLFVNDAYRATLEPADFISRWYIDFNDKETQKHKKDPSHAVRNFWDYAGVLAPPSGFRGGSELVVMRRSQGSPEEAFNLAEFLATDPQYTEMLAQYGHLPSLREGFGLDLLIRNLAGGNQSKGAEAFEDAAKKAIRNGQSYPDVDSFPTVLESKQVLESLQTIWYRMSDGDEAAVRAAAERCQFVINSSLDWVVSLNNEFRVLLPFLLGATVVAVCVYLWIQHIRNEQRLAVMLYYANVHAVLPSYGIRLIDSVVALRRGRGTLDEFRDRVEAYARHLSGAFYHHTVTMAGALGDEMQGLHASMEACELAHKAKEGAEIVFQAVWMEAPPLLHMDVGPCGQWSVAKLPHLATIILQEWLYNTLKEISIESSIQQTAKATISVSSEGFCIHTPIALDQKHVEAFNRRPKRIINFVIGGMGLSLIVNLFWLCYRRRPRMEYSDSERGTRVTFPFPMVRVAKELQ
jgi:hypothetical protein